MIRRPPRSTPLYSSAASDVYKRQGIVDPEPDRSEDPGSSFPECLGHRDEGLQAAAGGLRAEPVQQQGDVVFGQVTGEHRAQGLLEGIGPPKLASLAFELAQRHGLLIVEVLRILQQRPTGALESAGHVPGPAAGAVPARPAGGPSPAPWWRAGRHGTGRNR